MNVLKVRFSPFSVILVMVALSLVGIASIGRLKVQYKPVSGGRSISVSYRMPGASAEVVEAEATSRIEGVLSGLDGCSGVSSTSRRGSGTVTVTFDRRTDMAAARFAVASAVRNVYPGLPPSVTYPSISLDVSGNRNSAVLTYLVKGSLPSRELGKFAERAVVPEISVMKGVDKVNAGGMTPFRWVVTFDADKAASLGIKADDISSALSGMYGEQVAGMTDTGDGRMAVRLRSGGEPDFGAVPVGKSGDRLVFLRDIATWKYEEAVPERYYRINGLNTISVSVYVAADANMLSVISAVKGRMAVLQSAFPDGVTVSIGYDASEYVSGELHKIYVRTGLCLLILLLFVFLTSRSWRSTLTVASALTVNILVAVAAYAFMGIPVHIYTLAGITVSLGIVIDTTIVMADHYARCHDRGAFPDLVAAILTTVAALMLVLLLPESERGNITDFIIVIVINLCISLAVAFFFIPALLEYLPADVASRNVPLRRLRRTSVWNRRYFRYISWGTRHRWVYIVAFVAAFGIPLFLIPAPSEKTRGNFYEKCVRPVLSWKPYADNRSRIDKWAGSSFGMFCRALDRADFYREPEKKTLSIRAGMPEGCSVQQLNEVVRSMENYLASFSEISVFTTRVDSYDDATITVEFKPEYENSGFPSMLKSNVTAMAINFGGANWSVSGIDENYFNNHIVSDSKSSRIALYGYDYRALHGYAEKLIGYLSRYRRVSEPEIWGSGWNGRPSTEFSVDYDAGRLAATGVDPYAWHAALSSLLYERTAGSMLTDGELAEVVLRSSAADSYDLWHVLNEPVSADSVKVSLGDVGSIVKKRSGIDIKKKDQSYELDVCYDFIGSYELSKKVSEEAVRYMNEEVLPVGFRAENPYGGWFDEHKDRYAWLILLVMAVMYVMLAMAFESFRLPLAVLFMIPVSFIGLFLVFGLSDFSFDQGGFAALVMLCGVVVNAGIYLVNTWRTLSSRLPVSPPCSATTSADTASAPASVACADTSVSASVSAERSLHAYVRAWNLKVRPIMLTILSTVLGLLPFLSDGPGEVFWFDFAIGTIAGMTLSVIALIFLLPVFLLPLPAAPSTLFHNGRGDRDVLRS